MNVRSSSRQGWKIAGGAVALALFGALVLPALSAQYTSGAKATAILDTTTTFAVDIEGNAQYAVPFSLTTLAPGDTTTDTFALHNTSTIPAFVWIDSTDVTTTSGSTDFAAELVGTITTPNGVAGTGPLASLNTRGTAGTVAPFAFQSAVWEMAPGETLMVTADITLPSSAGNEVLGSAVTLAFNVHATQTAPVFP